jgi:hypothetical protein
MLIAGQRYVAIDFVLATYCFFLFFHLIYVLMGVIFKEVNDVGAFFIILAIPFGGVPLLVSR